MKCDIESRRSLVRDSQKINGIDFIEVLTSQSEGKDEDPYRALLVVRCFHPIKQKLDEGNIVIEGGSRIKEVYPLWAHRANDLAAVQDDLGTEEKAVVANLRDKDRVILVRPSARGDFSTYMLKLVKAGDPDHRPPLGFDEQLSRLDFSFKVECQGDFDCLQKEEVMQENEELQQGLYIDYMAKDYASFRRLMFDRLSVISPKWKERNAADMGVSLVELLAYVGDHLSYYQDAVATEAYLGTARRRVSVRRHARLLGYNMHDGCNSRAWVFLEVDRDQAETVAVPAKTKLLALREKRSANTVVRPSDLAKEIADGAEIFETMYDIVLYTSHNEIPFYTWADEQCYLPRGTTSATLKSGGNDNDNDDDDDDGNKKKLKLQPGDVLIFEEILVPGGDASSVITANASHNGDMSHRHAIRLTSVSEKNDPLTDTHIVEIKWDSKDALPFNLCVWEKQENGQVRMAVARGNIVLADHGNTIFEYKGENIQPRKEPLGRVPIQGWFRPKLFNKEPITFAASYDSLNSASDAFSFDPKLASPQITLQGNGHEGWKPVRDLINSDKFAYEFVAETENDGTVYIRFGDEETEAGRIPTAGTEGSPEDFTATYRTGTGVQGNVGAEAIAAVVGIKGILRVRNPMEARGGVEPETIENVRQFAPNSFRKQERAVTEKDYEEVLIRRGDIQKARAAIRWTGSWHTVFVAVDRVAGLEVDEKFEQDVRDYLENYRMAGYDIEVHGPEYVPLYISLRVMVAKGYFKEHVEKALIEEFTDRVKGFFHPDNFTFGQPVYLSQMYANAMGIPGVQAVDIESFGRQETPGDRTAIESGVIMIGPYEIAKLDNDPNFPENGKLEFHMEGGK